MSENETTADEVPPKREQRQRPKKKIPKKRKRPETIAARGGASHTDYPRHTAKRAIRVPRALLEQNAGRPCSDADAAQYCGMGYHGPFKVEISSAIKYGLLERPEPGKVAVTDLARQILRPKSPADETEGLRKALLNAPLLSEVYKHYRGENLPDDRFFCNTLTETFKVPQAKLDEFKSLFLESLKDANLIEDRGDKQRVLDVSQGEGVKVDSEQSIKRLGQTAHIQQGDTCFVMMPFADPIGGYFKKIYEPAIEKTGLKPIRADDDMFTTGKIIDQIWTGIHGAKVLVAELTGRNPNVFYELGLAHALQKPVVLVASNEADVPFDVQHIRVIYYDMRDPFWGDKLIAKLSENVLSAVSNPQEAIFKRPPS